MGDDRAATGATTRRGGRIGTASVETVHHTGDENIIPTETARSPFSTGTVQGTTLALTTRYSRRV